MPVRFTVLGSGSSGNASLLEADGFGLLIDAGLGPRQLGTRLAEMGSSWNCVQAVILTHTHGDHWNERTLAFLQRRRLPLYCHADHHSLLAEFSEAFAALCSESLVSFYDHAESLPLSASLRCHPMQLRHDGGPTFGFRFEGTTPDGEVGWAVAYLTDLGSWTHELADSIADVDILALEFNHDVALQYASGRSPRLIARVLGDAGHLSNKQAAELLREILHRSEAGRVRHVVQLHLSRDCNRPELALMAAHEALNGSAHRTEIHSTSQYCVGPCLVFEPSGRKPPQVRSVRRAVIVDELPRQLWLPGWDPCLEPSAHGVV